MLTGVGVFVGGVVAGEVGVAVAGVVGVFVAVGVVGVAVGVTGVGVGVGKHSSRQGGSCVRRMLLKVSVTPFGVMFSKRSPVSGTKPGDDAFAPSFTT